MMSRTSIVVIAAAAALLYHAGGARRAEAQQPPLDPDGAKYGEGCVGSPYPGTPGERCRTCCTRIKDNFTTSRTFDLVGCIGACTVKATPPLDRDGAKYGEGCVGSPYPGTPADRCKTCCTKIKDNFTRERIFDLDGCISSCTVKATPPLDREGPKYGEGCAGSPYPGTPADRCNTCCSKIRDNFTTQRIFDLEGCKRGCVAKASRMSAAAGTDSACPPPPAVSDVKKGVCVATPAPLRDGGQLAEAGCD